MAQSAHSAALRHVDPVPLMGEREDENDKGADEPGTPRQGGLVVD